MASNFGISDARAARAVNSLFATSKPTEKDKGGGKIEVIAAGLPRCATSSLQAALQSEWLDYKPTFHMAEVLPIPRNRKLAIRAASEPDREKRHKLLAEMLDGYRATTDFPTTPFAVDLMDMYPDAKIILNQRRSGAVWAKSVDDTIVFFQTYHFALLGGLFAMNRDAFWMMHYLWDFSSKQMGTPNPYNPRDDPSFGRPQYYDAWQSYVRAEAAKRGREVLEWQPEDGWAPICAFLGKPVPPPSVPFPKTNETAELLKTRRLLYVLGAVSWGLVGVLGWLGVRYGPGVLGVVRSWLGV